MMLWRASFSSFSGVVPWASHWFARLHGNSRTWSVEWRINAEAAEEWNGDDRSYLWQEGAQSNRFMSEEEAVGATVCAWHSLAGPSDFLVRGDPAEIGPMEPLAGCGQYIEVASDICARADAVDWRDRDEASMKELEQDWDEWFHNFEDPRRDRSIEEGIIVVRLNEAGDRWVMAEPESIND